MWTVHPLLLLTPEIVVGRFSDPSLVSLVSGTVLLYCMGKIRVIEIYPKFDSQRNVFHLK